MKRYTVLFLLATCGLLSHSLYPTFADTETTTVETTKVTKSEPISLPTNTTYVLVDPITGTLKGDLDTTQTVSIQTISPGAVVIDKSTGDIVATVDPAGSIISMRTAPAYDPLLASIDARRAELDRMVTTALSNGTITDKQAKELRDELDKAGLRQSEDTRHGRMLTYSEALYLASALNDVGDRLTLLTNSSNLPPLIGSRFVNVNGNVIMALDDLDYRKYRLSKKIDDEYIAGKLMFPQVTDLRQDLKSVNDLEQQYNKGGQISSDGKALIAARLDNIEAKLNSEASATK